MKYTLIALAAMMASGEACSQTCEASDRKTGSEMPTPIETVMAFSAAIAIDNGKPVILRWFTHRTVWINEGVSMTTGVEEAIDFIERPSRSPDIAAVHFDMLAIAADGNRMLTERIDRFVRADGSEIAAAKLMGIFEAEGDCIVAWRDYFDVNFAKKISKNRP